MTTIVTRSGKGSPLTHTEMDANLTNLNNNKLEAGTAATNIANTPAGNISATNIQAAINELDTEKAKAGVNSDITTMTGLTAPTVAANPVRAVDLQNGAQIVAIAGGTSDAITVAFTPALTAFSAGPIWWRASAANTTTTPTLKRDGLAAKTLVKGSASTLLAGDIPGAGAWMCSQYDATLDKEVLLNPANGVVTLSAASSAEAQAFAVTNKYVSPSTLAASMQGSNQLIATSGYQKLPGGVIIQWGQYAGGANNPVITFPIAFPSAAWSVQALVSANATLGIILANTITASSFKADQRVANTGAGATNGFTWFAVGN